MTNFLVYLISFSYIFQYQRRKIRKKELSREHVLNPPN